MGVISIRDDLLKDIAELAARRGISVEDQADELMRRSLPSAEPVSDRRELAESIASMTPAGVVRTDSVELLRQDRRR